MADRVRELIEGLSLQPHPEGGWYAEVFRSEREVSAGGGPRRAVTTIYYLLESGQKSRWHRIDADEVWHFYEGSPLELLTTTDLRHVRRAMLSEWGVDHAPVAVVPAGEWQAARTTGDYSLVGCSVAPGFEFSTFELLRGTRDDRLDDAPAEVRRFL